MKININGRSIMYLGDWGGGNAKDAEEYAEMERRLMDVYKKENGTNPTIKSDIVQIAHHGINDYMPALYAAIEADYAFFSQADASYNELTHICYRNIIDQLRRAGIQDENIYFAGRKTNWLTIGVDGTVTHGAKPFEGADAGYWDLLKDITPWNEDQTT